MIQLLLKEEQNKYFFLTLKIPGPPILGIKNGWCLRMVYVKKIKSYSAITKTVSSMFGHISMKLNNLHTATCK